MGYGRGMGFGYGQGRGYGLGRGLGRGKGSFSGYTCIKFVFFAFNVIFWLLGCAILGIGIWLQVSKGAYASIAPSFNFLSATALCIAAGILVLIVGFFGCCGAIMENQCMLLTYFVLVILIFVLEVVAAVLTFVYRMDIEVVVKRELEQGIEKKYPLATERDEEGLREGWAYVQTKMKCCGVNNYTDWYKSREQKIPKECCIESSNITDCNSALPAKKDRWHKEGCLKEVKSAVTRHLYIVGVVSIGIGVVQVLGMVAAMALFCCIRADRHYDDKYDDN